jgi:HSP20 family molecular chaperone IbpA
MEATSIRIPLQVNHSSNNNNESTTFEFNNTSSFINNNNENIIRNDHQSTFEKANLNDETDRIKLRMKDFEERCKKWRDEFFNRTFPESNNFNTEIEVENRVPLNNNNNNYTFSTKIKNQPPYNLGQNHNLSHRTSIEDLPNNAGKKYKIEFDLGDFKQNELQISTCGSSTLVVKGDREVKAGSATETKTFNREITLPEYVDIQKINAYLLEAMNDPQHQQKNENNNVLVIEAPVIMEKYTYRRSVFDTYSSIPHTPQHKVHVHSNLVGSRTSSPSKSIHTTIVSPPSSSSSYNQQQQSQHFQNGFESGENLSSTKKSNVVSTATTTKIFNKINSEHDFYNKVTTNNNANNNNNFDNGHSSSIIRNNDQFNLNQSMAPELIRGYPIYDSSESCVVYKFDFSGFDQTEIQLTITLDRTLEIKAR